MECVDYRGGVGWIDHRMEECCKISMLLLIYLYTEARATDKKREKEKPEITKAPGLHFVSVQPSRVLGAKEEESN